MRRLIVNADDFGLATGVNQGIIRAHTHGIVTSASLMVLAPAAREAARAAAAYPSLSVGLHFTEDRPEVLDDPARLAAAFAAQLSRFRSLTERDPTHVDSHHHVHLTRLDTFGPLVAPLGVPLRGDGRVVYLGGFYAQPEPGRTDLSRVSRTSLLSLLLAHGDAQLLELGCHPGQITADLHSSYGHERAAELATLTAPGLQARLQAAGLQLVSFAAATPLTSA